MIRNGPSTDHRRHRRGLMMLECAFVYSVALQLILGVIVLGLGVFRYQEMAWLAREGARWAAVHGPDYQSDQSDDAPTSTDVMTQVITPKMAMLTSQNVKCTLTMTSGTATVTVTYTWAPEAYFASKSLSSTAVAPIMY